MEKYLKVNKEVLRIISKSAEKERAQIIKKIYDLGFEVGVKNHSEIGWVLREYNDLIARASKLGIKMPDSYYADGKTKGKTSRDKNIEGSKTPEKVTPAIRKVVVSDPKVVDPNIQKEEARFDTHLEKPSLNERPKFIEKGSATEIPRFLEGFRPNKRK
ncbi:MAG: hypothetical protein MPEBLZ_03826 [Candidatus Methanoperedens nitroreducens]|uniref:Uncharacterized protein n=1 Tax=Candidatus Methanoperedens nitratireducens TaxID=1392998 RepID=A0A0P7ZDP8_9EURY|nr:hypothetical protein [Candidatus Methanoperedens sp. BLZ2]KAB2946050.1 MAG: hypothetical protein F9K14_08835 [Candidatus Methanoperedens sp.]KPQ41624.1 MAG: hypothetical protein MPEBLZ_03826 [Candidatus Methanoperedens sp. BLZ1]MBZ0174992.1 hypothetical protein [Candidatus Methanoperedens nitroreducens]CAG0997139.1 hypothetical protein METP2_02997 [Methanosarcinales archaeon]MCX9076610.1 hypothetical protein [Candidatus Methanoperedens sp.]